MVQTDWRDEDERRLIDDVQQYGWHIVGVGHDEKGPAFAYSVGIYHTLKQPEVIIFGLGIQIMAQIINAIGDEGRKGRKLEDWEENGSFLEGHSCIFRQVEQRFYREYVGYARWFYRGDDFPVLQCVWPDRQGRYPWHPEFTLGLRERQPVLTGNRSWRFREGKNRAVFTTQFVLAGTHPILHVSHDVDGDWQFLCGTTNRTEDARLVSLSEIVQRFPVIEELADLTEGWQAVRESQKGPWLRFKSEMSGNESN